MRGGLLFVFLISLLKYLMSGVAERDAYSGPQAEFDSDIVC